MLLAVALVLLLVAPMPAETVDGRYQDFGDPGGFRNILPPGQVGVVSGPEQIEAQLTGELPAHVDDQLGMYDALRVATPDLAEDDVDALFKDASFGVAPDDIGRVYAPTDGVTVIRDASYGVPHIFGETREATMFAQGYTSAEDRLFLMDILRHLGRARLSEFLGASEANQQMDRDQLAVAPYREEDLTAQTVPREDFGDAAQQIRADGEAYIAGINAYVAEAQVDPSKRPAEYEALQQQPEPFVLEDIVAIASLVGGIFGGGGGRELANLCGIQALAADVGEQEARAIFDDLKLADDAEAPTTTDRTFAFPRGLGDPDPAAVPDVDCATLEPIDGGTPSVDDVIDAISSVTPDPLRAGRVADGPFGPIPLAVPSGASNAALVSGERTATGQPIAVFGPQTAYFSPQLLVEKDVHGPGISARGVAFAGVDVYVQLGRGRDYAWSATSSKSDAVDTFVLELCDPGGGEATVESMGHRHDDECVEIDGWHHTQIAKPTAASVPEEGEVVLSWRVERSPVYGPLIARGQTRDGTPIAVATSRTTYNDETVNALGFFRVNDPEFMADGYEAFRRALGEGIQYSFNWFYVDGDDIGYQSACSCPLRAPGTDPDLPVWGTGDWDWRGAVPLDWLPWDVNPARGYIADWNNKIAPGWRAADSEFSFGPVHRKQLLDRRLGPLVARGNVTRAEVVEVVGEAATTDLRGQELVGLLERLLGQGPPAGADERAGVVWEALRAWAADGFGHRRDRSGDGAYEHPLAVAAVDAWWPRLVDAVFAEGSADAVARLRIPIHDPPQAHLGSAFHFGMYGQVHKDLRAVLDEPVADPFSRTYCGEGALEDCRAAVWEALDLAVSDLADEFGSDDPADWRRVPADDAIIHSPAGITEVADIDWQNRPTFHQVVQLPVADAPPAVPTPPPDDPSPAPGLPATGGGPALPLALLLVVAGAGLLRRRA